MWALVLDVEHAAALGPLRREPGVEAALVAGRLWLKGQTASDSLVTRLRQLPALARYTVQADQSLLLEGALVPQGYLPQGKWLPLEHWLPVTVPTIVESRVDPIEPVMLRLVRDTTLRQPNLLLTTLKTWADYAASAPQFRLQHWSFAANRQAQVLIRGVPLPPLPGRQLVEIENVAVEAGWTWFPIVEPIVLRRKLQLASGDLLLIQPGQANVAAVEVVPAAAFVKASRSAVRLTAAGAVV
jgi:hypothetical protein